MAATTKNQDRQDPDDPSVASDRQDARLEHSRSGTTTRDDVTDLGVPMLPGDPREPQGPEDALGPGPTRGDYRARIGDASYQPHVSVPVSDPEPDGPTVNLVPQRPFAEDIGDVPRRKGGVDSADVSP